jgi:hypothetical protein
MTLCHGQSVAHKPWGWPGMPYTMSMLYIYIYIYIYICFNLLVNVRTRLEHISVHCLEAQNNLQHNDAHVPWTSFRYRNTWLHNDAYRPEIRKRNILQNLRQLHWNGLILTEPSECRTRLKNPFSRTKHIITCIFRRWSLSTSFTIFVIASSTRVLCSSTIFRIKWIHKFPTNYFRQTAVPNYTCTTAINTGSIWTTTSVL